MDLDDMQHCGGENMYRLPATARYTTILLALLVTAACSPDATTATTESRPPQSVTTTVPRILALDETLTLGCKAVPVNTVDVASELPGLRIMTLDAEAGASVRQGQVMARLDTATLDLQLAQLASQRERAEEEFDRLSRLKPSGGVSLDQLSEKRLAMQGLQAQYAETELRKSRAIITAPADGWVYERTARIGQVVNAGEALFQMALKGRVEAECEVPEQYLARLRVGEPMTLSVTGQTSGDTRGTLRVLYPHINPQQRTAPLRVSAEWRDRPAIGTWIEGKLVIARHEGPALPLTALQQDNQGHFVWVVTDDVTRRQAVMVVHAGATDVIVRDLPPDQQVVARAGALLREGAAVVTGAAP
jgi:HlyD family secretion protein